MCGIVGYTGKRSAIDVLIGGLRRLEYRGYDSTGVAFLKNDKIEVRKSEGKLENVEKILGQESPDFLKSHVGIGHTRWATHGKPTTQNAHPHRTGHVVLVHNGIIENYQDIKADLMKRGHKPVSETDSELFGFLVLEEMQKGKSLVNGVMDAFQSLVGACSVVVMSEQEPGVVVGVRNGSPMVAAVDPKGGAIIASDAQPLLEYTRDVYYLENGDVCVATDQGLEFFELSSKQKVKRLSTHLDWSLEQIDKGGYPHYMLKEIYDQPAALVDTINTLLDRAKADPFPLAKQPGVDILKNAKEIIFVACGTSWHAALLAKYWIEKYAKIPVSVELASEFRYRDPVVKSGAIVVGISQSGETADTLAVIRDMKKQNVATLAITNVRGSSISRDADAVFYTAAGPEIGVASTKAFTAQCITVLLWAGALGLGKNQSITEGLFQEIIELPMKLKTYLDGKESILNHAKKAAQKLQNMKGFFFIGRGTAFPLALEGALKLKEIAYVHAEGYAAGELKHGPIAMIDQQMAVVALAPQDAWREKTISNLEEVKARGAVIVGVGNSKDHHLQKLSDIWIPLPDFKNESLIPFGLSLAVQMLSYQIAVLKGTDIDKPRNLAKSVTVE